MQGVIQMWGNSNAIRLPKHLLESVSLKTSDSVDVIASGEDIIIRKIARTPVHKTLAQRLAEANYTGVYDAGELDSTSVGEEVFW